jgi:DNA-directed RNA polymerase specialized sigma subunit
MAGAGFDSFDCIRIIRSTADLVTGDKNGDAQAWSALVERYAPLIWSICR